MDLFYKRLHMKVASLVIFCNLIIANNVFAIDPHIEMNLHKGEALKLRIGMSIHEVESMYDIVEKRESVEYDYYYLRFNLPYISYNTLKVTLKPNQRFTSAKEIQDFLSKATPSQSYRGNYIKCDKNTTRVKEIGLRFLLPPGEEYTKDLLQKYRNVYAKDNGVWLIKESYYLKGQGLNGKKGREWEMTRIRRGKGLRVYVGRGSDNFDYVIRIFEY
jgi:hypothetical protein